MGRAKDIVLKVIPSKIANDFVKNNHYSGKVVPNSNLHFGAFLDGKLHGVMSFGSPMDKSKVLPLVHGTGWNEMIELNRMAFDDYLPKNSESRCIRIAIQMLRKNAPQIKWVLSFSDGTQCGDGSIYRASGFVLTLIKPNKTMLSWNGKIVADKTLNNANYKKIGMSAGEAKKQGAKPLIGFQLRYIYLIDKTAKMNCQNLPFSEIDKIGAGMYKGNRVSLQSRKPNAAVTHVGELPQFHEDGTFDSISPLQQNPEHNVKD